MPPHTLPFPDFYQKPSLVFAHRGANKLAPENTLLAFEKAHSLGSDGVELDVQLSADNALVVIHDSDLKRLAGIDRRVDSLPLHALKSLDLGSQFGSMFQGLQIPTLDEAFDQFGSKLLFNVELKNVTRRRREMVERVTACIRRHSLQSRIIVSSFDIKVLRILRDVSSTLQIGQLTNAPLLPMLVISRGFPTRFLHFAHAIHPNHRFVNRSLVTQSHQANLRVNVWTVNSPTDIARMVELGVDMIITDSPDVAQKIIGSATGIIKDTSS